jgi:hypothetical protein
MQRTAERQRRKSSSGVVLSRIREVRERRRDRRKYQPKDYAKMHDCGQA